MSNKGLDRFRSYLVELLKYQKIIFDLTKVFLII